MLTSHSTGLKAKENALKKTKLQTLKTAWPLEMLTDSNGDLKEHGLTVTEVAHGNQTAGLSSTGTWTTKSKEKAEGVKVDSVKNELSNY